MATLIVNPTIDTRILGHAATSNYGIANILEVGEVAGQTGWWGRSLLMFDISEIMTNATIQTCTISLKIKSDNSSNARTMYAYRLKRNWVENQATYNKYNSDNNWQTAGATGANDYDATAIGSVSLSASESVNSWIHISITPSKVQEILDGTFDYVPGKLNVLLKMDTEYNDAYAFYSNDDATPENRPYVTIEYTMPDSDFSAMPVTYISDFMMI